MFVCVVFFFLVCLFVVLRLSREYLARAFESYEDLRNFNSFAKTKKNCTFYNMFWTVNNEYYGHKVRGKEINKVL